jgi:hypothetical protein
MLGKLDTLALVGIDAMPVEVEVDAPARLPKTVLVGLLETAVKESVQRIGNAQVASCGTTSMSRAARAGGEGPGLPNLQFFPCVGRADAP